MCDDSADLFFESSKLQMSNYECDYDYGAKGDQIIYEGDILLSNN